MRKLLFSRGYTIIEVLIVMTVSVALFATAVVGYGQQNRRTQFTNAVHELELNVQDVLNDIGTGYYPNNGSVSCTAPPAIGAPTIGSSGAGQGTNAGCIFVGKAIEFSNTPSPTMTSYTLVGRQYENASTADIVDDLSEAEPVASSLLTESSQFSAAIQITKIVLGDGTVDLPTRLGVVSGFGDDSKSGAGATTNQVSLMSYGNDLSAIGPTQSINSPTLQNGGMTICIREQGGNRQAMIRLGNNGRQLAVETVDQGCA